MAKEISKENQGALPRCACDSRVRILYYDADIHRCLIPSCGGYILGEHFGKPIEKFKGSYDKAT